VADEAVEADEAPAAEAPVTDDAPKAEEQV